MVHEARYLNQNINAFATYIAKAGVSKGDRRPDASVAAQSFGLRVPGDYPERSTGSCAERLGSMPTCMTYTNMVHLRNGYDAFVPIHCQSLSPHHHPTTTASPSIHNTIWHLSDVLVREAYGRVLESSADGFCGCVNMDVCVCVCVCVYGGGGLLRFSFTCVNPTHDTKDTVEFLYKRFQQLGENGTRSLDAGEMRLLVQSVFEKHKDQVSY